MGSQQEALSHQEPLCLQMRPEQHEGLPGSASAAPFLWSNCSTGAFGVKSNMMSSGSVRCKLAQGSRELPETMMDDCHKYTYPPPYPPPLNLAY
eukprot:jgi/Psemu1/8746/gm1.8746_g